MSYSSLAQIPRDEVTTREAPSTGHISTRSGGIKHAKRQIILATFSVSLPLLILGGILVGLVGRYQLDRNDPWFTSLEFEDAESDSSAYYLNMSATRFVTVASWISNIAASLSGLVMLISVTRLLTDSFKRPKARTGGITSVYEMIRYSTWKEKAATGYMLTHTFAVLSLTLMLSAAIWGLDTWLHVSTKATLLTQSLASPDMYHNYSRHISCDETTLTFNSCSTNDHGLAVVGVAFEMLNNMSDTNMVSTYQDNSQTFAYVTDAHIENGHSFAASTIAISTQCTSVFPSCNQTIGPDETDVYVDFETSCAEFTSTVRTPRAVAGMNSSMIWLDQPEIIRASPISQAMTNPFYFMAQTVSGSFHSSLGEDPDRAKIYAPPGGYFVGFSLSCTSSVYEINYTWVNGSFHNMTASSVSNDVLGNTFSAPFQTGVGMAILSNAAATAAGMPSIERLADTFSTVFSKTAMSLGGSVSYAGVNLGEGETVPGARVPKRPLITLLVIMLLYAIWAAILGVLALMVRTQAVDDVQARLSVAGVIASGFEEPVGQRSVEEVQDLFAESSTTGKNAARLRMTRTKDHGNFEWGYTGDVDIDRSLKGP